MRERKYHLDGVIEQIVVISKGKTTITNADGTLIWENMDFGCLRPSWLPRFMWVFFPAEWKIRRFLRALWANGEGKYYDPKESKKALEDSWSLKKTS